MSSRIELGDCLEVLRGIPDSSVDSIVTDPPYGLSDHKPQDVVACLTAWLAGEEYKPRKKGFMGRSWDAWVPGPEVWSECLRVLKPGGHLLAFAGTRSMDLMSMAVRLAGFELRDSIGYANDGDGAPLLAYCYGSGFPKSHNGPWGGTSLKPAWEPVVLARKPLIGTVEENWRAHGTGALNIDACRVPIDTDADASQLRTMQRGQRASGDGWGMSTVSGDAPQVVRPEGRWPANLIHDGSDEVVALFPANAGAAAPVHKRNGDKFRNSYGAFAGNIDEAGSTFHGDTGSAARFFYCAKASRQDRNEGLPSSSTPAVTNGATMREREDADWPARNGNHHPTVKPTDLMAYLCRLVTPPGGVVLDPFMGSGSTGKAAVLEGFSFIGIEREAEYVAIARARIDAAMKERESRSIGKSMPLFQDLEAA